MLGVRDAKCGILCRSELNLVVRIRGTEDGLQVYIQSMQKTKKSAVIPLGKQALEWMPERGTASLDDRVFTHIHLLCNANRALKRMTVKAGIDKSISFHCSRHTFATLILTAGSDIYTASEMLGHTNIQTTEIYADVVMEKKVDAVNMLNGIF